jgi:hypothetical protein
MVWKTSSIGEDMKGLLIAGLLAAQIVDPAQLKSKFFPEALVTSTEQSNKH